MSTQPKPATIPTSAPSGTGSRRPRRFVVKAGTSLLTRGAEQLAMETMATLVEQIASLHQLGVEIMLVSSGAVASGYHVLGVPKDAKYVPLRQALAAVGQVRLVHAYEQHFDRHGIHVAQALLTRRDIKDRLGYLNIRNTLVGLLEHRVVPIINENDVVAVEELAGDAFGDNDTLSSLVANLVDADLLVMLGEVEGLLTADPHLDPNARLIPTVNFLTGDVESLGGPSWGDKGRGGMTTKLDAARFATASGVNAVIASGLEPDVLTRLAAGESIGTYFPATSTKLESRKRWILSEPSKGEIVVDDGAATALRERNGSLLPAGVTEVAGEFERGDTASVTDSRRVQIAVGIANYSSGDLAKIKGLHSGHIVELLEYHYGDEVMHRNNMVIL